MRTIRPLLYPLALLAATTLGFGAPKAFEGKVTFMMTTDRGSVPLTYYVKGGMIRTEMEGERGRTIVGLIDPTKREMTMLMTEQKMYMVYPMPDATKASPEMQERTSEMEFKRTGQYETILGHRCEKIIVKTKDGTAEIWGAENMGQFMNPAPSSPFARRAAAPRNAWEAELASRGFFPLRVIGRDNDGKQTMKMEATEIDTSTPPDSLFVPPPDYRKFEMPNLGGFNPFKR